MIDEKKTKVVSPVIDFPISKLCKLSLAMLQRAHRVGDLQVLGRALLEPNGEGGVCGTGRVYMNGKVMRIPSRKMVQTGSPIRFHGNMGRA